MKNPHYDQDRNEMRTISNDRDLKGYISSYEPGLTDDECERIADRIQDEIMPAQKLRFADSGSGRSVDSYDDFTVAHLLEIDFLALLD